jgi:hypothetical protein
MTSQQTGGNLDTHQHLMLPVSGTARTYSEWDFPEIEV